MTTDSDRPYTRLHRKEEILKTGYAGLGAGTRTMTFAPGKLFLTDRRLIIESRLETDRSSYAYALSSIVQLDPLEDGFAMALETGITETVIVFGDAAEWFHAVDEARATAPRLAASMKEGSVAGSGGKRMRAVSGGIILIAIVLGTLALCIAVGSIVIFLRG